MGNSLTGAAAATAPSAPSSSEERTGEEVNSQTPTQNPSQTPSQASSQAPSQTLSQAPSQTPGEVRSQSHSLPRRPERGVRKQTSSLPPPEDFAQLAAKQSELTAKQSELAAKQEAASADDGDFYKPASAGADEVIPLVFATPRSRRRNAEAAKRMGVIETSGGEAVCEAVSEAVGEAAIESSAARSMTIEVPERRSNQQDFSPGSPSLDDDWEVYSSPVGSPGALLVSLGSPRDSTASEDPLQLLEDLRSIEGSVRSDDSRPVSFSLTREADEARRLDSTTGSEALKLDEGLFEEVLRASRGSSDEKNGHLERALSDMLRPDGSLAPGYDLADLTSAAAYAAAAGASTGKHSRVFQFDPTPDPAQQTTPPHRPRSHSSIPYADDTSSTTSMHQRHSRSMTSGSMTSAERAADTGEDSSPEASSAADLFKNKLTGRSMSVATSVGASAGGGTSVGASAEGGTSAGGGGGDGGSGGGDGNKRQLTSERNGTTSRFPPASETSNPPRPAKLAEKRDERVSDKRLKPASAAALRRAKEESPFYDNVDYGEASGNSGRVVAPVVRSGNSPATETEQVGISAPAVATRAPLAAGEEDWDSVRERQVALAVALAAQTDDEEEAVCSRESSLRLSVSSLDSARTDDLFTDETVSHTASVPLRFPPGSFDRDLSPSEASLRLSLVSDITVDTTDWDDGSLVSEEAAISRGDREGTLRHSYNDDDSCASDPPFERHLEANATPKMQRRNNTHIAHAEVHSSAPCSTASTATSTSSGGAIHGRPPRPPAAAGASGRSPPLPSIGGTVKQEFHSAPASEGGSSCRPSPDSGCPLDRWLESPTAASQDSGFSGSPRAAPPSPAGRDDVIVGDGKTADGMQGQDVEKGMMISSSDKSAKDMIRGDYAVINVQIENKSPDDVTNNNEVSSEYREGEPDVIDQNVARGSTIEQIVTSDTSGTDKLASQNKTSSPPYHTDDAIKSPMTSQVVSPSTQATSPSPSQSEVIERALVHETDKASATSEMAGGRDTEDLTSLAMKIATETATTESTSTREVKEKAAMMVGEKQTAEPHVAKAVCSEQLVTVSGKIQDTESSSTGSDLQRKSPISTTSRFDVRSVSTLTDSKMSHDSASMIPTVGDSDSPISIVRELTSLSPPARSLPSSNLISRSPPSSISTSRIPSSSTSTGLGASISKPTSHSPSPSSKSSIRDAPISITSVRDLPTSILTTRDPLLALLTGRCPEPSSLETILEEAQLSSSVETCSQGDSELSTDARLSQELSRELSGELSRELSTDTSVADTEGGGEEGAFWTIEEQSFEMLPTAGSAESRIWDTLKQIAEEEQRKGESEARRREMKEEESGEGEVPIPVGGAEFGDCGIGEATAVIAGEELGKKSADKEAVGDKAGDKQGKLKEYEAVGPTEGSNKAGKTGIKSAGDDHVEGSVEVSTENALKADTIEQASIEAVSPKTGGIPGTVPTLTQKPRSGRIQLIDTVIITSPKMQRKTPTSKAEMIPPAKPPSEPTEPSPIEGQSKIDSQPEQEPTSAKNWRLCAATSRQLEEYLAEMDRELLKEGSSSPESVRSVEEIADALINNSFSGEGDLQRLADEFDETFRKMSRQNSADQPSSMVTASTSSVGVTASASEAGPSSSRSPNHNADTYNLPRAAAENTSSIRHLADKNETASSGEIAKSTSAVTKRTTAPSVTASAAAAASVTVATVPVPATKPEVTGASKTGQKTDVACQKPPASRVTGVGMTGARRHDWDGCQTPTAAAAAGLGAEASTEKYKRHMTAVAAASMPGAGTEELKSGDSNRNSDGFSEVTATLQQMEEDLIEQLTQMRDKDLSELTVGQKRDLFEASFSSVDVTQATAGPDPAVRADVTAIRQKFTESSSTEMTSQDSTDDVGMSGDATKRDPLEIDPDEPFDELMYAARAMAATKAGKTGKLGRDGNRTHASVQEKKTEYKHIPSTTDERRENIASASVSRHDSVLAVHEKAKDQMFYSQTDTANIATSFDAKEIKSNVPHPADQQSHDVTTSSDERQTETDEPTEDDSSLRMRTPGVLFSETEDEFTLVDLQGAATHTPELPEVVFIDSDHCEPLLERPGGPNTPGKVSGGSVAPVVLPKPLVPSRHDHDRVYRDLDLSRDQTCGVFRAEPYDASLDLVSSDLNIQHGLKQGGLHGLPHDQSQTTPHGTVHGSTFDQTADLSHDLPHNLSTRPSHKLSTEPSHGTRHRPDDLSNQPVASEPSHFTGATDRESSPSPLSPPFPPSPPFPSTSPPPSPNARRDGRIVGRRESGPCQSQVANFTSDEGQHIVCQERDTDAPAIEGRRVSLGETRVVSSGGGGGGRLAKLVRRFEEGGVDVQDSEDGEDVEEEREEPYEARRRTEGRRISGDGRLREEGFSKSSDVGDFRYPLNQQDPRDLRDSGDSFYLQDSRNPGDQRNSIEPQIPGSPGNRRDPRNPHQRSAKDPRSAMGIEPGHVQDAKSSFLSSVKTITKTSTETTSKTMTKKTLTSESNAMVPSAKEGGMSTGDPDQNGTLFMKVRAATPTEKPMEKSGYGGSGVLTSSGVTGAGFGGTASEGSGRSSCEVTSNPPVKLSTVGTGATTTTGLTSAADERKSTTSKPTPFNVTASKFSTTSASRAASSSTCSTSTPTAPLAGVAGDTASVTSGSSDDPAKTAEEVLQDIRRNLDEVAAGSAAVRSEEAALRREIRKLESASSSLEVTEMMEKMEEKKREERRMEELKREGLKRDGMKGQGMKSEGMKGGDIKREEMKRQDSKKEETVDGTAGAGKETTGEAPWRVKTTAGRKRHRSQSAAASSEQTAVDVAGLEAPVVPAPEKTGPPAPPPRTQRACGSPPRAPAWSAGGQQAAGSTATSTTAASAPQPTWSASSNIHPQPTWSAPSAPSASFTPFTPSAPSAPSPAPPPPPPPPQRQTSLNLLTHTRPRSNSVPGLAQPPDVPDQERPESVWDYTETGGWRRPGRWSSAHSVKSEPEECVDTLRWVTG